MILSQVNTHRTQLGSIRRLYLHSSEVESTPDTVELCLHHPTVHYYTRCSEILRIIAIELFPSPPFSLPPLFLLPSHTLCLRSRLRLIQVGLRMVFGTF